MIRYQPNAANEWRRTKSVRKRITTRDTANAVTIPTASVIHSIPENAIPVLRTYFAIFNRLAPSMTGMARKNENSAAAVRDTPAMRAPMMVLPEREVPGIREST